MFEYCVIIKMKCALSAKYKETYYCGHQTGENRILKMKKYNKHQFQNVNINTDEILHMLNDVKNVQLKAVMMIKEPINVTKKLPIKSIINKEYDSGKKIYWNFRRLVPFGRYSLAIGSYTDDGKEDSMMIMDTQLIKKVLKKMVKI